MEIVTVDINKEIINSIKKYIIDDVIIINFFSEGICIIQNISSKSNINFFIKKKIKINKEINIITEDINILTNFLFIKKINEINLKSSYKFEKINDICNFCYYLDNLKNCCEIRLSSNEINKLYLNTQLKKEKINLLTCDNIEGILLKINKKLYNIYINITD